MPMSRSSPETAQGNEAIATARNESSFDKVAAQVDEIIRRPFERIGEINGTYPKRVMGGCVTMCILLMYGLSRIGSVTERRADKLWYPQDTATQRHKKAYEESFPRTGGISTVIAESKDSNALTKAALQDLMGLHESITATSSSNGNTLADLCVSSTFVSGTSCYQQNILAAWSYNANDLAADNSVLSKINSYFSTSELEEILGKASYSNGAVTSAKAIKTIYYLKDDTEVVDGEYVTEDNDLWEEKFLKVVDKASSSELKYYAMATRSWADVFGDAIRGDLVLINLAYLFMIIYLSVNLGKIPCRRDCPHPESRVLLALSSVLAILLAMGSAFGFCALLGFLWTPVHTVLPFVILGLGVDDSFVIVNAFDQTDRNDPMAKRMRDTLAHAATSITVTSLTDFVAFAISTSSSLPALSSFCMYASIAILFVFLLQISFFAAAVCLDEERQQARRIDCCPCCTECCSKWCAFKNSKENADGAEPVQQQSTEQGKPGVVADFMERYYAPFLLKPWVRIGVICFFCSLLVVCCSVGLPNLSVEDNERSFITDGSYLLETLEKNDKYFSSIDGETCYVVTKNIDYFAEQSNIANIKSDIEGVKSLVNPDSGTSYLSWYDELSSYCETNSFTSYTTNEGTFYECLNQFLTCSSGSYLADSVVYASGSTTDIVATRIKTEFKDMSTYNDGRRQEDAQAVVRAMDEVRDVDWSVDAFPWSYAFSKWEAFKIIQRELFLNIILCLASVLVITTLLIGHPQCSGLVFICVAMTVLDILGFMYFWGLFIDNVSVIQLVIAVGLCVDYAAHVGHCFMFKSGTREERVIAALKDVGAAVLNGGISTFLAVVFLSGSASYVFRVLFKNFFLTVVLGLAHGMILLPVLLAYFGPNCYASVEVHTKKKAKESTLGDLEMPGQLEAQSNKLTEGSSKDPPIAEGQLSPSPDGSSGYEGQEVTG